MGPLKYDHSVGWLVGALRALSLVYAIFRVSVHLHSIFLDFLQQTVVLTSGAPGYAMTQGEGGAPVAVPLPASGVTIQTQSSYGYALAGQTNGVPVPFQAVGGHPHCVGAISSGGGFTPQDTENSPNLGQYAPPEEKI